MSLRDERFAKWVGQKLADYADGTNGYMAHDVLYIIQNKWEEYYGDLPEEEW